MLNPPGRPGEAGEGGSILAKVIRFCLETKVVVFLGLILVLGWGLAAAPFDWDLGGLPRSPIPVDAIPDIGENQQIVFTDWMGRSPQDVEDQITYPLTVALLGIPGVKTVRSFSFFGFSTIYIIFKEGIDFYWSRSRVLEKLGSLPRGTLPEGVQPALGPDATPLGQVFWYTLEGLDPRGRPTGGWDLDELRTVQDWYVRYALLSAEGVSEVASIGGFVKEYQIDVDPDAMRAYGVGLADVFGAVRMSNLDVGARNIEINRVEYFIRGLGFIKSIEDIEQTVVKVRENVPVRIKDVANVTLGPALRRGVLDKEGAEVVGGVVVVRYGENPLATIKNVKEKIEEISPGLPKKIFPDGTISQVRIVPFYDRTGLIQETLGTLDEALILEILVTIVVVLVMVAHLKSSLLISGLIPLAILSTFISMKIFGVEANIVALSGIAIAIGAMVDIGIVICENILRRMEEAPPEASSLETIFLATREVGGAVLTAVATTVVSFLPVFTMVAAEGKLFKPLAFTKTSAMITSIIIALTVLPALAHLVFSRARGKVTGPGLSRWLLNGLLVLAGIGLALVFRWWAGAMVILFGLYRTLEAWLPEKVRMWLGRSLNWAVVLAVGLILSASWLPLGPERGGVRNFLFVAVFLGGILVLLHLFRKVYRPVLIFCLDHKLLFLSLPLAVTILGGTIWLGFGKLFGWLPEFVRTSGPGTFLAAGFPGLGKEFMPPLDEGSYLFMPTTMPHASIGEALDILQTQDMAIESIPEVESVVGKLGRVDSSLDPAPISMFETVINYKPQYLVDRHGRRLRFRFDPRETDLFRDAEGNPLPAPDGLPYKVRGRFARDDQGRLIPDSGGMPFRLWRPPLDPDLNEDREAWPGITEPDDIWRLITMSTRVPGTTTAPKLQPIMARIVMLQSGMRAPMGVKVRGPDLKTIERVGFQIEGYLKEVEGIEPATVVADRIVGKPYLEIEIDRRAIARYGIHIKNLQEIIEVAIGGKPLTTTIEGRERYSVRVRYLRELRDNLEALGQILVPAADGAQIPLVQLADIRYVRGPQVIKSEDTFLVGYVVFDKKADVAEVDVVEKAQAYLKAKIENGEWELPAGVNYTFAGSYENQIRAQKTMSVVLPVALLVIFIILYLQLRSILTTVMVFSGILVAWSGGFILLGLYGQPWFLDFSIFGASMRDLFQVHPINLSVAIWVGFLALFGIATDSGVLMATVLNQNLAGRELDSREEIRTRVVEGSMRRIRPALMTSAVTILALLPVLTSTGRGSDIMVPMAIPSFGGMLMQILTVFVVPVLYSAREELRLGRGKGRAPAQGS